MKKSEVKTKIISLLNEFPMTDRIDILEEVVDKLRKRNSIEMAKEVEKFAIKTRSKKNIDKYVV